MNEDTKTLLIIGGVGLVSGLFTAIAHVVVTRRQNQKDTVLRQGNVHDAANLVANK